MEGQRKESLCRLSEQVLAVAANAITNAINTEAIAKAVDTEAITDAITAGLKEIRFKNETAMQASIIGEKIGESVASAVESALTA
jgi:predicted transcriptional regulator